MSRRSPTLEGFRILWRIPALGLAEIAWRWAVGAAFVASVGFALLQYLRSLPVTAADILLLRTRHPLMVSRALAHIFAGSAARFFMALVLLAMTIAFAWIVVAAVGRAVTLKTVLTRFFPERVVPLRVGPIIELNSLRAASALAALIASFGALLLAGMASPKSDPAPGSAMLIFLMLALIVWVCWAMLNWLLSLAAIFVVARGETTSSAVVAAVDLLRRRFGRVLAIGVWFGLAHGVAYVVASSAIGFPLAFAGLLPGGVILGGVILTALAYFAIADYLYVGRMAAYAFLAEGPEPALPEVLSLPDPPARVDSSELILSDLQLTPGAF
jgi:hypothetical protein